MFDGNRVTAHTRSRYPIFQSPMTWIARAPLVTAVSKAGAMGLLENSIRDLTVTKSEFTAIRAATNAPFGVNLPIRYLQMDPKEETAIIDWLLGQGIHFATTSAGDPTRYTKLLKAAGVTVYHATATLRGAQKAVDAGVDGLIVEGAESAGIRNPERSTPSPSCRRFARRSTCRSWRPAASSTAAAWRRPSHSAPRASPWARASSPRSRARSIPTTRTRSSPRR